MLLSSEKQHRAQYAGNPQIIFPDDLQDQGGATRFTITYKSQFHF